MCVCVNNQDNEESYIDNLLEDRCNNNQNFRQEALNNARLRQEFLYKANLSHTTKIHPAVTAHYLDKVNIYTEQFKK